jgi:DNA polymerase-3 subunit epsilon
MSYPVSLIFDTETTGLPPKSDSPKALFARYKDWGNTCRIVQIAWSICGERGEILETYNAYVKPEGYMVSPEATKIHGFSTDFLIENGIQIQNVLTKLMSSIEHYHVTTMVAHNLKFDYHVVMQELYKLSFEKEMDQWKQLTGYCTLKNARAYCKNNGIKPTNFKLATIYQTLLNKDSIEDSIQLHQADSDVILCKELYYKMIATSSKD